LADPRGRRLAGRVVRAKVGGEMLIEDRPLLGWDSEDHGCGAVGRAIG